MATRLTKSQFFEVAVQRRRLLEELKLDHMHGVAEQEREGERGEERGKGEGTMSTEHPLPKSRAALLLLPLLAVVVVVVPPSSLLGEGVGHGLWAAPLTR